MSKKKELLFYLCPECKLEMSLLTNSFFTIPFFSPEPEIRGQVCQNTDCSQFGIERRHPRQNERLTRKEYKEWLIK